MKVLIAYATKYGFTEMMAEKLAENIGQQVQLVNLKKEKRDSIKLSEYDAIAVGGSIYAGNIQKEIKEFYSKNKQEILKRPIGLFLCCAETDKIDEQLELSFDRDLLDHAVATGHFGYQYNFDKMNFLFKMMVRVISKQTENETVVNEDNIKEFADKLVKAV